MRRVLAAITLLVATCATALITSTGAGAVHPSFDITLTTATPDPGASFGFSGHCDNADAIGKAIHVRLFQIIGSSTVGEVSPVVDASGNFTGSFDADWAPVPGWYQVVALCPLQAVEAGYQASPIFLASLGLTPQPMTVHTGPGDADKPLQIVVDVSGAGCDGESVYWRVLDGSSTELAGGMANPDVDGNWASNYWTTPSTAPADDTRTAYAWCTGGEDVLGIYTTTNAVTPPVTEPTTPTTATTAAAPTTTAPATAAPAPAAAAVRANPTYTG